jgi:hypothetical protein
MDSLSSCCITAATISGVTATACLKYREADSWSPLAMKASAIALLLLRALKQNKINKL